MFFLCIRTWISCIECFLSIFWSRLSSFIIVSTAFSIQMFRNKSVFKWSFLIRLKSMNCLAFHSQTWINLSRIKSIKFRRIIIILFNIFWHTVIIWLNMLFNYLKHICCKLKQLLTFVFLRINSNGWWMISQTSHFKSRHCSCWKSIAREAFSIKSNDRISLFLIEIIRIGFSGA